MFVPSRTLLTAGAVLWLCQALAAAEPAKLGVDKSKAMPAKPGASANQKTAETIAERLRQSAQLRGYKIDIVYQNGIAEVSGWVGDQPQHDEALRLVQGTPGVERVRDNLKLIYPPAPVGPTQVRQVQAAMPPMPNPVPVPGAVPPGMPPAGAPMPTAPPGYGPTEPLPIYQVGAPGGSPYALSPPHMPPYAWPTYAPYNNFSRVAIPTEYPYNAWPFIGPPYPFPKVPLGWRNVELRYMDGHWWFSKNATCHDYWRIRYW